MRFTAYNQYVHKTLHRWGPNVKEMMAIRKYLATQNITLKQPPYVSAYITQFNACVCYKDKLEGKIYFHQQCAHVFLFNFFTAVYAKNNVNIFAMSHNR